MTKRSVTRESVKRNVTREQDKHNATKDQIKHSKSLECNEILKELIDKQRKNIPADKKLQYADINRICKYIKQSIFDEGSCCLWVGYVTNVNKSDKGTYVNFYFKKKKAALHRLLYINFVSELTENEYLKFTCENKGTCCNITHLAKFTYNKSEQSVVKKKKVICKPKIKNSLIVNFD